MVFVETSFPRGAIAKPIDGTPESTEPDIVSVLLFIFPFFN